MPKMIKYRVIGRGDFPTDMLRYDGAWPSDTPSAANIAFDFLRGENGYHMWRSNPRVVALKSYQQPTPARWDSFGWRVVDERICKGMSDGQVEVALSQGGRVG
jgi:hypothetical protein